MLAGGVGADQVALDQVAVASEPSSQRPQPVFGSAPPKPTLPEMRLPAPAAVPPIVLSRGDDEDAPQVVQRLRPGDVGADLVALDQVAGRVADDLHAVGAAGHDVGGAGVVPPIVLPVAPPDDRIPAACVANRHGPGDVGADQVALDEVARGGRCRQSQLDVPRRAGDHVGGAGDGPADRVVRPSTSMPPPYWASLIVPVMSRPTMLPSTRLS